MMAASRSDGFSDILTVPWPHQPSSYHFAFSIRRLASKIAAFIKKESHVNTLRVLEIIVCSTSICKQ